MTPGGAAVGSQSVRTEADGARRRAFMRRLLDDMRALEQILERGLIETDVRRIGAEQEMFLIDRSWRPANAALRLLERVDDPRFTTELGLFNLELNLDPQPIAGRCLRDMEERLDKSLDKLREVAGKLGVEVLLTGILPTIRQSDLGLDNMTPKPRYRALNRAMTEMRGDAYEFHIRGLDQLLLKHDSVMLEACNASFQIHFQVGAEEFANLYNIAQVVTAPVLAAAANSPLLFGRQLWRETRIALFQQAVDTRSSMHFLRERAARVTFGRQWVKRSVLELFQEDIARFRTLVTAEIDTDPLASLERGEVPDLPALRLFNSTVYRWNRACYGITGDRPHLRIENRVLPAGPTVVDEVANAAFWFGLISAFSRQQEEVTHAFEFEKAKMNFTAAARLGLNAQFYWFDGKTIPAGRLICDRLIPMAEEGLKVLGLDEADIDRYLGVLDERVRSYRTGAQWIVQSLTDMRGRGTLGERLNALVAAMASRQKDKLPVSKWQPARLEESGGWKHEQLKVEQYMTTDLYTVHEDEPLDLVASVMEWKQIRHIPVEDREHRLVGLVSYRSLLRLVARGHDPKPGKQIPVSAVMRRNPTTIGPDVSILRAIAAMRQHRVSCLPVVRDGRLMGIITERDFMNMAAELLEENLRRLKE